jgi:hypothetical protein
MKKLLSAIFIFLVLLKAGGFMAILSVQREIVRENMIEQIAQNCTTQNLTCIVDNKKIEWEETDKEFWYENKLYDVVKIETKNGLTHYYCLADNDETEIVSTIKNLVQSGHEPLSQTMKGIIGWIFQQIIMPEPIQPRFENYCLLTLTTSCFIHSRYFFENRFKIIKPPQKS